MLELEEKCSYYNRVPYVQTSHRDMENVKENKKPFKSTTLVRPVSRSGHVWGQGGHARGIGPRGGQVAEFPDREWSGDSWQVLIQRREGQSKILGKGSALLRVLQRHRSERMCVHRERDLLCELGSHDPAFGKSKSAVWAKRPKEPMVQTTSEVRPLEDFSLAEGETPAFIPPIQVLSSLKNTRAETPKYLDTCQVARFN